MTKNHTYLSNSKYFNKYLLPDFSLILFMCKIREVYYNLLIDFTDRLCFIII